MNRLRRSRLAIPLPCFVAGALVVGAALSAASPGSAVAAPTGVNPLATSTWSLAAATATVPSPALGRPNKRVCPGPLIGTAGCHARVITDSEGTPLATSGPSGYGPAQFHGAYELPTTASTAQTIAIVDAYDDPTIESDLAFYSSTYGLPACTKANGCFRKVNQSGQEGSYPKADSGWSLEIALDVETAHAICQNCKIILLEASSANFSDLTAAVNEAAALGATEISNSYGGPEFSSETSATYANPYNHPGIPVTVSAGDSGYGAEYPASSPYVVAVGGTTLKLGSGNSYSSESAWSESGSGCSAYTAAQAWQTADAHWGSTGCGSKRGVSDIAADANPSTGASVYDTTRYQGQSGWFTVGGTSLSAPLIAGVYALAGGGAANYPAADPYSHQSDSPASLHDVTSGSNGTCGGTTMCAGATGYDGPTGVGTPKGIAAFAGGGVDTTPPQTTITSEPASSTNDSTPTFSFSSSEAGSTFECRIDAAAFAGCSSPYTSPPLADGSHTFEVRAKDSSGNTDQSPAKSTFTVDTQAPVVSLTSPAQGSVTGSSTPAFSGTGGTAPGDSAVTVKLYTGTGTSGTPLQTLSATPNSSTGAYTVSASTIGSGTYTARTSQTDSAGNTGFSEAHTFTVDTNAPTSQATSTSLTNSTSITVSYTASDSGGGGLASVELWVKTPGAGSYVKAATDSSPGASGSFPYTASAGDGTYSFYTRATDGVGNYEAAPGSADSTTLLDTTPPQTTITSAPPSATNDSTPTFAFSSSEAGSTFECRVDAAAFAGCTSPYTTGALADGSHTFEVRATDTASNTDQTPASAHFTVDTAAPSSEAESVATTNSTTITVGYTASDAGTGLATVELWVKTPGAAEYTKAQTDSSPSTSGSFLYGAFAGDGTYSFYTRATDKAGNYEAVPASADTTTVLDTSVPDTTPPETTITSGPKGPTNDSTPSFAFTSNELGSTFECRVDAGAFAPCTSPYTATAMQDGHHTFEVTATDPSSNTDLTPAKVEFEVDTKAPEVSLEEPAAASVTGDPEPPVSGVAGTAPGDSSTVTVTIHAGANTGGTVVQTLPASVHPGTGAYAATAGSLGSGTYTVQVTQSDSAGNTGVSTARTFTVDTVAPTSQASSPSLTNFTSIAVSYTADDAGGSGLARVELWVKTPGKNGYAPAPGMVDESPGASGSFAYEATAGDGTYSFYTRATDRVGNEESAPAAADSITTVETQTEAVPPLVTPSEPTAESSQSPPPADNASRAVQAPSSFRLLRVEILTGRDASDLVARVPGPGTLVVSGRRVKKVRRSVSDAGQVKLPIRPRDRFKGRLDRAKVAVTYTPAGGDPITLTATVRLR